MGFDDFLCGEFLTGEMVSDNHTILVRPFLYGQFRIQLCRSDRPDPSAPPGHGSIVRELCTYQPRTVWSVVMNMRTAKDPEAYCETLAKPWNCEHPRGRIRLDNKSSWTEGVCADGAAILHDGVPVKIQDVLTALNELETYRAASRQNREPLFVCPKCSAESWNENDRRNRYCVRCHEFFDEDGHVSTAP